MKNFRVESVDELRERINVFGSRILFRGQTNHYARDGFPSVATSFDRHGCIPPIMIKWHNYAKCILSGFFGKEFESFTFTHAILQHYGWRSWYVDCTTNPHVAAWFASHCYRSKLSAVLVEDHKERPVFLKYRPAAYDFSDGNGYLYLIDQKIAEQNCGLTDLTRMKLPEARLRAAAQSAWLLGPLQNRPIPNEAFLAQITAPRQVLLEMAQEGEIFQTSDLFPNQNEDPILRVLLSLPWKLIDGLEPDKLGIPAFQRSLDLPEYHDSFQKIMPSNIAFYRRNSIGDPSPGEGIVISLEDSILYGSPDKNGSLRFPKVQKLVEQHREVVFEVDDLMRHPNMLDSSSYQKGLVVVQQPSGVIGLCELIVEHPGLDLTSSGPARGWFYRINADGVWTRETHEEECRCGHDPTHLRHLESLSIVESLLQ